jgi:branched-subunit amino acid ABC-type transport system permease component
MATDELRSSTNNNSVLAVNSVLLVILMLFTLFGNFVLFLSIWKNKRLHKVTHMHTVSLIVANFIPATTIIPLRIARIWNENDGVLNEETTLCEAYLIATLLWCVASILTLVSVSLDRYIAISKPDKYSSMLTHNRTFFILLTVWCFAILVSFLSLYHTGSALKLFTCNFSLLRKENYVYLLLTVEVIPLILMFVIHYQITKLSAKHAQSIGVVDSRFTEYRSNPLDFPTEVRWSRVVILIILLYVLMWAPRCIYLIVDEDSMSSSSDKAFDVLTEVITYSFAGLAPLVLVHFNSDMREEFFRILMPYQWFRKSHGVGKKYRNTNVVTPFDAMM